MSKKKIQRGFCCWMIAGFMIGWKIGDFKKIENKFQVFLKVKIKFYFNASKFFLPFLIQLNFLLDFHFHILSFAENNANLFKLSLFVGRNSS